MGAFKEQIIELGIELEEELNSSAAEDRVDAELDSNQISFVELIDFSEKSNLWLSANTLK